MVTLTGNVRLDELIADGNTQFESLIIPADFGLVVPSGTVLRATKNIVVAGTLGVRGAARYGWRRFTGTASNPIVSGNSPEEGLAGWAPDTPGLSITGVGGIAAGGQGGGRFTVEDARFMMFDLGALGGGGGWLGPNGGSVDQVEGAGSVTLIAGESLEINGRIEARSGSDFGGADPGSSGAGGGFVLLASKQSVRTTSTAVIDVRGAAGGGSANFPATAFSPAIAIGGSGGGGGGCVHLVAPAIVHEGTAQLTGGAAGANSVVDAPPAVRSGGYGGGAGCGAGGRGGGLNNGPNDQPSAGQDGRLFRTVADPTALL